MKWYHRLMCFVLAWNLLSFASTMAPWLLHEMVSSFSSPPWISLIKLLSQIPSLAACICVMCILPLYLIAIWLLAFWSSKRLPQCWNGTRNWILSACAFDYQLQMILWGYRPRRENGGGKKKGMVHCFFFLYLLLFNEVMCCHHVTHATAQTRTTRGGVLNITSGACLSFLQCFICLSLIDY